MIDTHCHLSLEYYDNLSDIIKSMYGYIITSGTNNKTNREVIDIVNKYSTVYGTLGIHPEEIDTVLESDFKFILNNLNNKKIVAIGEIGLDYYWRKDNKDEQIIVFKKQLELAEKHTLPVVIHSRDAIQDVYDTIKNYKLKGVIHCFNSSLEMAKEFIKQGYYIGVGGMCTFKNCTKIQQIIKEIPLSSILLETDSPYLTPLPFRGRKNEPSNVLYVAKKIAELKNITLDTVLVKTTQNAINLFDLNIEK